MSPAGGSMESQLDAKTLASATAWELHIAFLKRLGVDVDIAMAANIISAPLGGKVRVERLAADVDGKRIINKDKSGFLTCFDEYEFTREDP